MRAMPGHAQRLKLPYIYMQGLLNIDQNDEQLYTQAVKAKADDKTISPMFLIAQTLPLLIHVLADRECPILPLGTVNTRNTFKIHRPKLARDISALRTASEESKLSYRVYFGGFDRPGYRRKRGVEFCISVDVLFGEDIIVTQELWVLQFLTKSFEPRYIPDGGEQDQRALEDHVGDGGSHTIRLATSDPHKWAASTKDYNRIHVSHLGAKIFGFKSVIAHGNHLVALATECLRDDIAKDQDSPSSKARQMWWEGTKPIILEARFIRPTTLPAESHIAWRDSGNSDSGVRFTMSSRGKVCISGSLIHDDTQIPMKAITSPIE
ncbi:hypothetical protein M409DRAFT_29318 [Zasmidium cellare ATCC 36951]|uniref:Uncharacterized protein n=1 Tax=Zasmidium cellare ATCC 36951 TaxID=1080233 RepID=A0A6A6C1S3_ZASCE|nr:uncharacterized protein M409DRAFT_29318 [Zasmidium cellare ATCC 36951]KAF2160228.1 hypothetical protein M409DRAFT_29318 [Zasmidium cellare ATCC 36951]